MSESGEQFRAVVADLNRRMLAALALPPHQIGPEPLRCPACGRTRMACVAFYGRDRVHDEEIRAALGPLSPAYAWGVEPPAPREFARVSIEITMDDGTVMTFAADRPERAEVDVGRTPLPLPFRSQESPFMIEAPAARRASVSFEAHPSRPMTVEIRRSPTPQSLPSIDTEWGGVSVRVDRLPDWLPVTGKDGHGEPTPTVRELAAILLALPAELQDMPVARYCDDGVSGMRDEAGYRSEHREDGWTGDWTRHVQMW